MRQYAIAALAAAAAASAHADVVTITIRNLQAADGAYLTPVLFMAHDGGFDFFDAGSAASMGVERLAEDGTVDPLRNEALASGRVGATGVAGGAPIAPGAEHSIMLDLDPAEARHAYLSYMSMVIPSNDAFIGNDNATMIPVFNGLGRVIRRVGLTAIIVPGAAVWDAGTEVNDEIPENTAFLGQSVPDTGVPEGGLVGLHAGFQGSFGLGGATGNILTAFPGADFTLPGAVLAEITITPAPGAAALLALGLAAGARRRR